MLRAKESKDNLREEIYHLGRRWDVIARDRDRIVALSPLVPYTGRAAMRPTSPHTETLRHRQIHAATMPPR